jgi:putative addiction module killer protein
MFTICTYLTKTGHDLFTSWLDALKDKKARTAIARRLIRVETQGNFGDHKPCKDGVWEMRIDVGQGYRIYYAQSGETVILLLCGGDKSTQKKDIPAACRYWRDWQQRKGENDDKDDNAK